MLGAERNTQIPSLAQSTASSGGRRSWIDKMALLAGVFSVLFASVLAAFFFDAPIPQARADNVTTALTVLNTPPVWTSDAQESTQSSTSTPTNAGSVLSFVALGTDSSNDNYWLLICSASSTPTPHIGAAPTCGSGLQWAVSGVTTSGTQATAATTTTDTVPFLNESNSWYAYICDGNAAGPACNKQVDTGSGSTASPFVINHPPVFSAISNNSPQDPGGTITWTTTAYDTDVIRGSDTVKLYVCKANDFVATSSSCGAGGTWAQSSFVSSNPATSTTLAIPLQDKTYNAYVFVTDQNNLVATSTFEASNSSFVVNAIAPSIDPTTISLVDPATATSTTFLTLTQPMATSGPYYIKFHVVDNNSCQNASSGNEISIASTSIYRSDIGFSACQAGNFNANNCYPSANTQTHITCAQDTSGALTGDACSGPGDSSVGWVCTFSLWYSTDATVPGSTYAVDNWLATVQAQNDTGLYSSSSQSTTGNEVDEFLAFNVTQASINYGGLQPGQQNDPLATTTNLITEGNVGLDESLYGDTMCTTWSGPDSCDVGGADPTRKIPVSNQEFATSSVAFASGVPLTSSTSPSNLAIHVPKTTATSSPQTKNTYWGANVPGTITVAGNYNGQNTITAVTSNSAFW